MNRPPPDDPIVRETTLALEIISVASQVLEQQVPALERLVAAADRFDSVGHILDPTLYRAMLWSDRFKSNIAIARDTLAFLEKARAWRQAHLADMALAQAQAAAAGNDVAAAS